MTNTEKTVVQVSAVIAMPGSVLLIFQAQTGLETFMYSILSASVLVVYGFLLAKSMRG